MLNGRDVSERKAFEEQLAHHAFHDPVTHLANRALFNERVRHAVARSLRDDVGMAVLFVDLDDFKTVNDSLGHAVGDRVLLRGGAADLDQRARGRHGGALRRRRVRDPARGRPRHGDGGRDGGAHPRCPSAARSSFAENQLVIRASLGISIAEAGNPTDADELIRNADAAMYIAKADGKGGYRRVRARHARPGGGAPGAAAPTCSARSSARSSSCTTSRWCGSRTERSPAFEALVRWRHPSRGFDPAHRVHPARRGDRADRADIGRWVLREGCRQAKELRERTSPTPCRRPWASTSRSSSCSTTTSSTTCPTL